MKIEQLEIAALAICLICSAVGRCPTSTVAPLTFSAASVKIAPRRRIRGLSCIDGSSSRRMRRLAAGPLRHHQRAARPSDRIAYGVSGQDWKYGSGLDRQYDST